VGGPGQPNELKDNQAMRLVVPSSSTGGQGDRQDSKVEQFEQTNGALKAQAALALDKRQFACDVYENDEMIDCFMDDIDEMSMCEGSRQSQQDFNYNARGTMSQKKNVMMDGNAQHRGAPPTASHAFPYPAYPIPGGGRSRGSPFIAHDLDKRGQLGGSNQKQDSSQTILARNFVVNEQAARQPWAGGLQPGTSILSADGANQPSYRSGNAGQGGWMSGEYLPGSESMLWTLEGKFAAGTPRMYHVGGEFGLYPGMNETPTRFSNVAPGAYSNFLYMDPALFHDNISQANLNQSQSILDINVDHRASRADYHASRGPATNQMPAQKSASAQPSNAIPQDPTSSGNGQQLIINQGIGSINPENKNRNVANGATSRPNGRVDTAKRADLSEMASKTENVSNSPTPQRNPQRSSGVGHQGVQRTGANKDDAVGG